MSSKSNIINKHKQALKSRSTEARDFIDRNFYFILLISYIIYPLAIVWSALTEGGNIYSRAIEAVHSPALAALFTALVVLFIESGVIIGGMGASNDITEGVFGEDSKHKQMFFGKLVLFLFCYALSCNLSLDGSTQTTWFVSEQLAAPTLATTDSVDTEFRNRIQRQEAIISDARTMTWKGKITRKGSEIIAGAQSEIAKIEQDWANAQYAVADVNQEARDKFESKTESNASWAWYISILGQIVVLLCMILRTIYRSGENNLIANLETLTNRDIDGDGIIGKPLPMSPSPPTTSLDAETIATAVAAALDQRGSRRKEVRPFVNRQKSPEGQADGPVGAAPTSLPTTPIVGAVGTVPQQSQRPQVKPPTVVGSSRPQVVRETVEVRVDSLKRDISTYYPRCFSKEVTEKGSKRPSTRSDNRAKVEQWVQELRDFGIDVKIDFDHYQPIIWN